MSKILKDSTYAELKAKADAMERIILSVQSEEAPEMTIEEQTDAIIAALESASEENNGSLLEAVQVQLDAANVQISDLQMQLQDANNNIVALQNEIDNIPAEAPASIAAKNEPGAKEQTLADFANKNAGDTAAIIARAKEEGLI